MTAKLPQEPSQPPLAYHVSRRQFCQKRLPPFRCASARAFGMRLRQRLVREVRKVASLALGLFLAPHLLQSLHDRVFVGRRHHDDEPEFRLEFPWEEQPEPLESPQNIPQTPGDTSQRHFTRIGPAGAQALHGFVEALVVLASEAVDGVVHPARGNGS